LIIASVFSFSPYRVFQLTGPFLVREALRIRRLFKSPHFLFLASASFCTNALKSKDSYPPLFRGAAKLLIVESGSLSKCAPRCDFPMITVGLLFTFTFKPATLEGSYDPFSWFLSTSLGPRSSRFLHSTSGRFLNNFFWYGLREFTLPFDRTLLSNHEMKERFLESEPRDGPLFSAYSSSFVPWFSFSSSVLSGRLGEELEELPPF